MDKTLLNKVRQRIAEPVSKLTLPSLGTLHEVFCEAKASVSEERARLRRQLTETRDEGFAAMARLELSVCDEMPIRRLSYFEQINRRK